MIRFCDREVGCEEYALLTRIGMIDYFVPDHKDDIICVYDNFDTMGYIGMITYDSFRNSIGIDGAIRRECVILNADIWKNTREYFENRSKDVLLPVLNEAGELICFAYEDSDANREIRMLQELQESPDILQFTDIYPEFRCVKIYEFNELAFFFAKYLEKLNIPVEVNGEMWQDFFNGVKCQALDYECLTIYAEGIEGKTRKWKENLLKSVSVEFECIDKIYEANIKNGNIKDADGDFLWLIERLRNEREIVIIGTGIFSLNVCDLLLANDIDIFCFMSEDENLRKYRIVGKKVLSDREISKGTKHPVFLECCAENSAWGFGGVDGYGYRGYQRNRSFFLVKDYIDIPVGNLQNVLRGKNVFLLGNLNLCYYVSHALEVVEDCNIVYWDLLEENLGKDIRMAVTDGEDMRDNDICLLIEPQYYCYGEERCQIIQRKEQFFEKLREKGINNITEYFSNNEVLISIQRYKKEKYTIPCLTPNKIVLNISGHMSGNTFIESILDSHHPDMLMMNSVAVGRILGNMFLICVQLSEEKTENILREFWKIYSAITTDETTLLFSNKGIFSQKMEELLAQKETFTSQELFVMIHMAYEKILGRDISDVQNMLLYHEQREERNPGRINYEAWLCDEKVSGYSIMLTRNAYTRVGSFFRFCTKYDTFFYPRINAWWEHMVYIDEGSKIPDNWKRFRVKFETLKTEPVKTLQGICDEVGLSWSEDFLEDIFIREKEQSADEVINNFNLKPAYNLYEEFFSDFDRFRIDMMFSGVQRQFGYPYVRCLDFSRRQLQEMFLKEFRFERKLAYASDYYKMRYRKDFIDRVRECLQKVRRDELYRI
ncbi:MAG: hypothetical protein HDR04_03600 [Lachnospiraceae bacterium]|nr:hypothetical protein [Lachnospiraceae bacterium]